MKKLLSIVLSSLLLVTCLFTNVKTLNAYGPTHTVDFGTGSWNIGDVTVSCDKNGTITNIEENTEITLTNFNPDTMEVKVSATDGFSVNLNVNECKTSLANKNEGVYPNGILTFVVQAKNQDGPGPGPGPQKIEIDQDGYPIVPDGNLKIMTEQNGFIGELRINNQGVPSNQERSKFATKINDPSSFTLQIQLEFGKAVSSISINDVAYSGEQLVPDSGTIDRYTFNGISADQNGMLKLSFVEAESTVSTIIWTYDEKDPSGTNGDTYSQDTLVQHGKVEIVSIKRGDDTLYEGGSYTDKVAMEGGDPILAAKIVVDIEGQRGYVRLEKGDDIVIKLIPDYGYQLITATINDRQLSPLSNDFSNVSTFKLDNVQGQMHFSGVFEETDNTYTIGQAVTKVSNLSVDDKSTTVASGTLNVSLNNANNFDVSSVSGIENYVSDSTVDITIDNIVSQGSENNYWSNKVSEFNNTIDVSMNINEFDSNSDYKVVRQHTDDKGSTTVSVVDSSIDNYGVLTFKSDKFSSYMILKKNKALDEVISSNTSAEVRDKDGEIISGVNISEIKNADLVLKQHFIGSYGTGDEGVNSTYNNFHTNVGIDVNKTLIIDIQPKIVGKYSGNDVYADVVYNEIDTMQIVDVELEDSDIKHLGIVKDLSNYNIHVVREHNGIYESINAVIYSVEDKYHVVFDSNKFSLYAIYATEKTKFIAPKTGIE